MPPALPCGGIGGGVGPQGLPPPLPYTPAGPQGLPPPLPAAGGGGAAGVGGAPNQWECSAADELSLGHPAPDQSPPHSWPPHSPWLEALHPDQAMGATSEWRSKSKPQRGGETRATAVAISSAEKTCHGKCGASTCEVCVKNVWMAQASREHDMTLMQMYVGRCKQSQRTLHPQSCMVIVRAV